MNYAQNQLKFEIFPANLNIVSLFFQELDFLSCLKFVTLIQVQHVVPVSGWR